MNLFEPRILSLDLRTAATLVEMKTFYHQLLGLPVLEESPDRISFAAGQTRLTFLPADAGENPFYHFALNIPENKILPAHQWLAARTALIPVPPHLQEAGFPPDVVSYRHWNAHAIFFFDPAGSVVELIARHDLANSAQGSFTSADLLCVSEIALVVDNVPAAAHWLHEAGGMPIYTNPSDQFAALGDEHGLLIVMQRGRVVSFLAPDQKAVGVFPTTVAVRGAREASYRFPGFPYQIEIEG